MEALFQEIYRFIVFPAYYEFWAVKDSIEDTIDNVKIIYNKLSNIENRELSYN